MDSPTGMHVAVSGWLLGPPSGANRRLLAIAGRAAAKLGPNERITVLHRPDLVPPDLPGVTFRPVEIAAEPTRHRVRDERRRLRGALDAIGATVFDHGLLPLPEIDRPTCLTLHDLRACDGHASRPRALARLVVGRACRRASAVVVPSAFTALRLRAVVPDIDPIVVPNGVVLAEPPPGPRRARADNGYLLHTGHLERRKNLEVVIEALAHLRPTERPDLALVGRDGGREARLRRLAARLGLRDRVHFLGVRDDVEVARLYAGARAIVVPSVYEGFGLCALEALAHGRPVLVAACGALPEVVDDAGICLPPDDPTAWAAAIRSSGDDGDAARAHRRRRAEGYGWDDAAARMVGVWRRINARGR